MHSDKGPEAAMKRMVVIRRIIRASIILTLVAVLSTTYLNDERFAELEFPKPLDIASQDTERPVSEFPNIDWQKWKEINSDIVGWITVNGTKIDYPILQAKSHAPDYYLSHDICRNRNNEGSIFLDAECEAEGLLSKNSVIFGHHLVNGKGFSAFAEYGNEGHAMANRNILLQTPEWKRKLEVIFIEITKGTSRTKVTSFEDDQQFLLWLNERLDASKVKLVNEFTLETFPERIWTFCTCSYTSFDDERTLVYAREIKS